MTRPVTRLRGHSQPVNTYSGPVWEEKVVRGRNKAAPNNSKGLARSRHHAIPQKPCNPIWSVSHGMSDERPKSDSSS